MNPDRIGGSPARVGGRDRVTGAQQYVADLRIPDMLHVKLVTLDCARARIASIDTTAAAAVPGVRLVMTPHDLPQPMPRFGPQFVDRPVLAVGETKYHGEPVAAVAAETLDAADEAARLVRVDYEASAGSLHRGGGARPGLAARPGPVTPAGRSPRPDQCPARASLRLGRRRRGGRRGRRRGRGQLQLPDGHPLRDRAACVHGRARRRRDRGLELHPASELAAEGHRLAARTCRCPRCGSSRPIRAAGSAASSTPSSSRWSRSWRSGPAARAA